MKKKLIVSAMLLSALFSAKAQDFNTYFDDASLRLDYIFAGNADSQSIYLKDVSRTSSWAGRRTNLSKLLLKGNGQITVTDDSTGTVIYTNSFSTLFQEWQSTEEATRVNKAFDNCWLIPAPKRKAKVTVSITNMHNRSMTTMSHTIDPSDILIRPIKDNGIPRREIMHGGPSDKCIDIAIVAEGYTADEQEKFFEEAKRAAEAIFSHEPFASRKADFNVIAVASPSGDSGPCIPREGKWKQSAVRSHYDTFYTDRYLMTSEMTRVADILGDTPYEHVIVLVNSPTYGGGGIYNQITLSTTRHATFRQVLVHEFGHAFGGLGDEYYYDDQYTTMYPAGVEPWEPNLTTLTDFASKWQDMLPEGTTIPTKPDGKDVTTKVGVYEGGGYQSKGVYRPVQECRMKINEVEDFCPVCTRAILRTIDFYTGK